MPVTNLQGTLPQNDQEQLNLTWVKQGDEGCECPTIARAVKIHLRSKKTMPSTMENRKKKLKNKKPVHADLTMW